MKRLPLRRAFGGRIRAIRMAMGLSQEDYADRCGLHRTFIGRVERGETNVTLETAERLARGANVTLAKLFESFTGEGGRP